MVTQINGDLFAPDVIADPYSYFGRLREDDPIHWNEKYQVWIITRHDDVVWLTRHNELFSSQVFKRDPRPPYPSIDESDAELYETIRSYQVDRFIQHDRPEHTGMRRVVHGYFTPKSMETWRPMVRSAIDYLLDQAEENGSMDLMRDFAVPLPLLVIAQMMDIPEEDRPYIRSLAEKLLFLNRGEPDRLRTYWEGAHGMIEYVNPLVDERMANPGDDLISLLATGEKRGIYTREQVLGNVSLLLVAGHETTLNLICNGTLSFMRNRDQWELLQRNPTMSLPPLTTRATEECLRFDASVKSIQRIAAEDVQLGGKTIRKDDRVRWIISSANRDPRAFDEPEKFDIARWLNHHVAFGSGVHHCLGATLARLEGQEALRGLVQRFPGLQLETDEVEYHRTINLRSIKTLPVSWS